MPHCNLASRQRRDEQLFCDFNCLFIPSLRDGKLYFVCQGTRP